MLKVYFKKSTHICQCNKCTIIQISKWYFYTLEHMHVNTNIKNLYINISFGSHLYMYMTGFFIYHACIFSWQSPGTLILAGFRCGSLSESTVLCSSLLQIHGTVLSAVILCTNPLLFAL